MCANNYMFEWCMSAGKYPTCPAVEFARRWLSQPIQFGRLYDDVEAMIGQIMDERGAPEAVRRIVEKRAYIPETVFYSLLGTPEQIRFRGAEAEYNMGVAHEASPSPALQALTWPPRAENSAK